MNEQAEKLEALWDLCAAFIKKHDIVCPESIYQTDEVYIESPDLLAEILEIVGPSIDHED